MTNPYDQTFYDNQSRGSSRSADILAPLIVELLSPTSVLDVGCGVGAWCNAFAEAGVKQCYGVDGPWVPTDRLLFPAERFTTYDFSTAAPPYRPPLPRDRFDLVISLEMFEHLPPEKAPDLVEFMTHSADTVVMGAAIPGQGGTHHVNEQWPAYWADLFGQRGYKAFDLLRPIAWALPVKPWYAQNVIVYYKNALPEAAVARAREAAVAQLDAPASVVHPEMLSRILNTPPSLKRTLKAWLRRRFGGARNSAASR